MKFRYFIAIAAAATLFVGCEKEMPGDLNELQVSSSYVAINNAGGSNTIVVTSTESWSFEALDSKTAEWLTVAPMSGGAGETVVSFSAGEAAMTRSAALKISVAGNTQYVNVKQAVASAEVTVSTCAEVLAGADGKTYRIKGAVSAIEANVYGNYNVTDETGTVYVYGTLDKNGATKNFASLGIENGDVVTVEGPKSTYNGKVELVDVTVIEIEKSLIKVEEIPEEAVAIEGGEFPVVLTCKGDGVKVVIPEEAKSWLSVVGIVTSGSSATVTFLAAPNMGGDRAVDLEFITTSAGKTYTAQTTISQKGSILDVKCAEFNAQEDGTAQYRVSGIVTKITSDSEKYGTNLYIKDATGEEVYLYGSVNEAGTIDPLVANHGVKVGDIITLVGPKSSYKGAAQMVKGYLADVKPVTPMKAADVAALEDDDKGDPQNYIMLTGVVTKASGSNKTDLATYGNFDLVDESGSVYVYGVSTGWNGETKKFGTLGVNEGDTITIIAYKTSYKGAAQVVGMYVSHMAPPVAGSSAITSDLVPTAYGDESTITAGSLEYYIYQVANYGDGIQFKKSVSYLANKTACDKIKKITLVPSATKTWYPGNLKVYAGNSEKAEEIEIEASDEKGLVFDLSNKDCKYFKIAETSGHAVYVESITVEYE